jgi:transcriptional regulator with XRE-family HTH domain
MTDQKTYLHELGKRLAMLRKEQGLTQKQLGDRVDVTQQVIAEYEGGYRNIPVYRLAQLAEALGVPVDDLMKGSIAAGRKRGPASKLDRLTEQIAKLPRTRQRFVIEMLEDAVARAQ